MESLLGDTQKMGPITVHDDSYLEPSPHAVKRKMGKGGSEHGRGMKMASATVRSIAIFVRWWWRPAP
jgi:hypothetical protein